MCVFFSLSSLLTLLLLLAAAAAPALYFIPSTHHCVTMINYSWKSVYHSVSVYLFFNVVVLVVDNAFVTVIVVWLCVVVVVVVVHFFFSLISFAVCSIWWICRFCYLRVCVSDVQLVYLLFNSSQHWRFVFANMKLF